MSMKNEFAVEDAGDIGAGSSRRKGAAHPLRWDILDNPEIKAETGWEAEIQEYWSLKTCKRYVKMYHIGKLWPRECHETATKNFACRPGMCKNDHVIHRGYEVWWAMFGDRPMSNKGLFSYSLLSMVYVELVLKRKVDWSTFLTTKRDPLQIDRNQKDIPDSFDPNSASTKVILDEVFTKKSGRVPTTLSTRLEEEGLPLPMQVTKDPSSDADVEKKGVIQCDSDLERLDKLTLSNFEENVEEGLAPSNALVVAHNPSVHVAAEVGHSQAETEANTKEKGSAEQPHEIESVLHDLEVARKERDEAREELEKLRRTSQAVDDTPCNEPILPWDDVTEMMDHTNHHGKEKRNIIDWALEVKEGRMPYNVFSSHFADAERKVIHTSNPIPKFLIDKCSLCLNHFGPEGAYILGQCSHMFHIPCIVESSLKQSVCLMCCSPISARFYEIMGKQHIMPPGHEFNRWNLPLDQLPNKFLNYRDWGRPLIWNPLLASHGLTEEYGLGKDAFSWMTQDYEVEVRARKIENAQQRELFCRNFGGHWSIQYNCFFRFPPKKVEMRDDGSWYEVEEDIDLGDEYKKYNRTPIGRALVLAKLEEAAKLHCSLEEENIKISFDRKIQDVNAYWRNVLEMPKWKLLVSFEENDEFVKKVVEQIENAIVIFGAMKVDRTGKRKRDDGDDNKVGGKICMTKLLR